MKTKFIILSMAGLSLIACKESKQNTSEVEKVVMSFVKAGDQQNVDELNTILHNNYRAVANRLFGSDEVSIIDKSTYLQLMQDGKIGGDKRKVEVLAADITGNNSIVKARLTGNDQIFISYLSLVQGKDGQWSIISDQPDVTPLN